MLVKVTYDFDIRTFEFWSGAKDRVDSLFELGSEAVDEFGEYVEECMDDGEEVDEGRINDFVWFDCDDKIEELEEKYGDHDDEEEE